MNKIDLEEIKSKIISYIEVNDYDQATFENKNSVSNMKQEYIEYIDFLLNEIQIKNENILRYAVGNFEEILQEIQQMLKERSEKHIEAKTEIIADEYHKNEEEPEMIKQNVINAEEQIEEDTTQIDYEERITQIIIDRINDAISQTARELEYIGINQDKIDSICDELYAKRNELFKFCGRLSEALINLDKKLVEFVQNINEEYIQSLLSEKDKEDILESKFKEQLQVDNSKNQIEKKAVENITKGSENNQKEHFIDGLNPDEIFDVGEKKSTDKSEFEGLDADDIF